MLVQNPSKEDATAAQSRKSLLLLACMVIVLLTGIAVMAGWYTHSVFLIKLAPPFPAMVFNTALGFFLCASGLLLQDHQKTNSFSAIIGFLVAGIGLLTLIQYAWGTDFKIDEAFIEDFLQSNAAHPGRMSVSTAVCFVLTGSSLIFIASNRRRFSETVIIELLCIFSILISISSMLDHIGIIRAQYSWFIWKTMAIHTSLCFIAVNVVLISQIWRLREKDVTAFHTSVPICLLAAALAFDAHTPLSIATGFAYAPFVLCAFWRENKSAPFLFACIGTALIILGVYASVNIGSILSHVIINRAVAIFGLWIIAWLIYVIKLRECSLNDQAEMLNAILNNTVDGIITIDLMGRVLSFNKACETIFEYKAAEVIGHNVKMLMPDPYHAEHDDYLKNYHDTGHKKIIGIGRTVSGRKKGGEVFPLDLSVSEVNVQEQKIYSGIVRDITDRKKAEDEIMRSNEELERFAYVASHDLQEPLRMVANFTALLEEEYKNQFDEQGREYMHFIIDAAERMQGLVGDLLEYSRIGYEDAGFSLVDCASHIKLAVTNLQEIIEETGSLITLGDLPVIYANPVRFARLMQNLIGNAIKYRSKDRTPQISINVEDKEKEWLFSVSDNGIGMKEQYLEQIFIIFKRLHGKKDYKGTGIGLAVCKKIVESFDGKIWAESKLGEGSTFYFTVPKKEIAAMAA